MKTALVYVVAVWAFLFSAALNAQTPTGKDCKFVWVYKVKEGDVVNGFRLYIDGKARVSVKGTARQAKCPNDLDSGAHTASVVAYNNVGEGKHSETINFILVDSLPGQPLNFKLIATFK